MRRSLQALQVVHEQRPVGEGQRGEERAVLAEVTVGGDVGQRGAVERGERGGDRGVGAVEHLDVRVLRGHGRHLGPTAAEPGADEHHAAVGRPRSSGPRPQPQPRGRRTGHRAVAPARAAGPTARPAGRWCPTRRRASSPTWSSAGPSRARWRRAPATSSCARRPRAAWRSENRAKSTALAASAAAPTSRWRTRPRPATSACSTPSTSSSSTSTVSSSASAVEQVVRRRATTARRTGAAQVEHPLPHGLLEPGGAGLQPVGRRAVRAGLGQAAVLGAQGGQVGGGRRVVPVEGGRDGERSWHATARTSAGAGGRRPRPAPSACRARRAGRRGRTRPRAAPGCRGWPGARRAPGARGRTPAARHRRRRRASRRCARASQPSARVVPVGRSRKPAASSSQASAQRGARAVSAPAAPAAPRAAGPAAARRHRASRAAATSARPGASSGAGAAVRLGARRRSASRSACSRWTCRDLPRSRADAPRRPPMLARTGRPPRAPPPRRATSRSARSRCEQRPGDERVLDDLEGVGRQAAGQVGRGTGRRRGRRWSMPIASNRALASAYALERERQVAAEVRQPAPVVQADATASTAAQAGRRARRTAANAAARRVEVTEPDVGEPLEVERARLPHVVARPGEELDAPRRRSAALSSNGASRWPRTQARRTSTRPSGTPVERRRRRGRAGARPVARAPRDGQRDPQGRQRVRHPLGVARAPREPQRRVRSSASASSVSPRSRSTIPTTWCPIEATAGSGSGTSSASARRPRRLGVGEEGAQQLVRLGPGHHGPPILADPAGPVVRESVRGARPRR